MTIQWTVGAWGPACGPRPANGSQPGGTITISQDRNELTFSGPGKQYSTLSCWDPHPGLHRVSHASGTRSWSNQCKSEKDGRTATIQTTLSATDDLIRFDETGKFAFVARAQPCTASSRRTRTYRLLERDAAVYDPALALTPPVPAPRCTTKGPAASLSITDVAAVASAGQRVELQAEVRDHAGCPSASAVTWTLGAALPGASIASGDGVLTLSPDAAEGELEVVATAGGLVQRVHLQVVSRARYEQLLDGERGRHLTTAEGIAGDVASSSVGSGIAVAEDRATRRKYWFAALLALTAGTLGMLGAVVMRRVRSNGPIATGTDHVDAPDTDPQRGKKPRDHAESAPVPVPSGKVCPTCGSMYGAEAGFCGNDGTFLVRAN